jgi:hypothetical protein
MSGKAEPLLTADVERIDRPLEQARAGALLEGGLDIRYHLRQGD